MIQIAIKSTETQRKAGTSKRGKPYAFVEQAGLVALPNGETRRVTLTLDDDADPLPAGSYKPTAEAFFVDAFGGLGISSRARFWVKA